MPASLMVKLARIKPSLDEVHGRSYVNQLGWLLIACAIKVVNRTFFQNLMIDNPRNSDVIHRITAIIFIKLYDRCKVLALCIKVINIQMLI